MFILKDYTKALLHTILPLWLFWWWPVNKIMVVASCIQRHLSTINCIFLMQWTPLALHAVLKYKLNSIYQFLWYFLCTHTHLLKYKLNFLQLLWHFLCTHTHTFTHIHFLILHLCYDIFFTLTFCGHKVNWVNMKLRIKWQNYCRIRRL